MTSKVTINEIWEDLDRAGAFYMWEEYKSLLARRQTPVLKPVCELVDTLPIKWYNLLSLPFQFPKMKINKVLGVIDPMSKVLNSVGGL